MRVAVVVGSLSDAEYAAAVKGVLDELGMESEFHVLSAHRTPDEAARFAREAADRGVALIIAIAGYAAHLGGVLAANTNLPVICVPVAAGPFNGLDALLACVQMPKGVPTAVTTVGKAGATNAALLAARILALTDRSLAERLNKYTRKMREKTLTSQKELLKKLGIEEA